MYLFSFVPSSFKFFSLNIFLPFFPFSDLLSVFFFLIFKFYLSGFFEFLPFLFFLYFYFFFYYSYSVIFKRLHIFLFEVHFPVHLFLSLSIKCEAFIYLFVCFCPWTAPFTGNKSNTHIETNPNWLLLLFLTTSESVPQTLSKRSLCHAPATFLHIFCSYWLHDSLLFTVLFLIFPLHGCSLSSFVSWMLCVAPF